MEAILAVMNTSEVVVKIRPEKDLGSYGIWALDLCGETGRPMQERMKEHERVYVQLVPMPPLALERSNVFWSRLTLVHQKNQGSHPHKTPGTKGIEIHQSH